jgi:hypothetical protein
MFILYYKESGMISSYFLENGMLIVIFSRDLNAIASYSVEIGIQNFIF